MNERFLSELSARLAEFAAANPAKDLFDRYHKESVTLLSIILFLLLGIILFSGNVGATIIQL